MLPSSCTRADTVCDEVARSWFNVMSKSSSSFSSKVIPSGKYKSHWKAESSLSLFITTGKRMDVPPNKAVSAKIKSFLGMYLAMVISASVSSTGISSAAAVEQMIFFKAMVISPSTSASVMRFK